MIAHQSHHIVILCSRLDLPGGIERAVVNTANLFDKNGYRVTLLILDSSVSSFYPVAKTIALIQLPLHFGITTEGTILSRKLTFLLHIRRLKKTLLQLKPDVIIGTEYQFSAAAFLAAKNLSAKVFAWEHHHFHWLKKSRFWRVLLRIVYPKLNAVICLNPEEAGLYQTIKCRVAVVPNFVEIPVRPASPTQTILSVGWLIKRKGVDLIPSIGEAIFEKYPEWRWKIIGTGEEENWLREEIKRLQLQDNIAIASPQSADLSTAYSEAALCVMPSRFECFPMVLLEAMSYGVPCLSFDCPTGPAFIITNEEDGVLVNPKNALAMANTIINLIEDEAKRAAYGIAAYKNVQRFSPDKIIFLWKQVFAGY